MTDRTRPYTMIGLRRQVCVHCGAQAAEQWSLKACAKGGSSHIWRPLCVPCDIELNRLVLTFLAFADAERLVEDYAASKGHGAHVAPHAGDSGPNRCVA